MDLRGAVALVTGGNGGLGQRICHALAKEGAHVAVMYAQSRDQAEGVARELTSSYQINAAAFACDITDGAAVERLIGDVTRRLGRIDILVNDAAYNKSISFTDLDNLTLEVWDKIMDVNLTGPMRLTKAVAPVMKAQGRGPYRQHCVRGGASANGLVHRLCGVEGWPHPPHTLHGGGTGARDSRQLRGAGAAGGHARDIQSPTRDDRAQRGRLAAEEGRRQG